MPKSSESSERPQVNPAMIMQVLQAGNQQDLIDLSWMLLDEETVLFEVFPQESHLIDAVIGQLVRYSRYYKGIDREAMNPQHTVLVRELDELASELSDSMIEWVDARAKISRENPVDQEQLIFKNSYGNWTSSEKKAG